LGSVARTSARAGDFRESMSEPVSVHVSPWRRHDLIVNFRNIVNNNITGSSTFYVRWLTQRELGSGQLIM
jgi:hypothetical protein